MLKNLTIRWRILLSFAVVMVMMIVMSGLAYVQLANIGQHTAEVKKTTLPGLYFSNQLMSTWMEQQTLIQEHILLDDPAEQRKVEARLEVVGRNADTLMTAYQEAIHQGQEQDDFATIKTLSAQYREIEGTILGVSRAGRDQEAHVILREKFEPLFARVQAALQTLVHVNKEAVDRSTGEILQTIGLAELGIALSFAGALILAMRQPDQQFVTNPGPETVVEPEHILIAIGTEAQLEALTSLARSD